MLRLSLLALALLMVLPAVAMADLSARQIHNLIVEYANPETESERRDAIVGTLSTVSDRDLLRPLTRNVRNDATRRYTIELIGRLGHGSAWELLRAFLDDEDWREPAMAALFAVDDDEVLDKLAERWNSEEPDTELSGKLTEAWKSAPTLTIQSLGRFIDVLNAEDTAEARREQVRAILIEQVGETPGIDDETLAKLATELREKVRILSTPIPISGESLFEELKYPSGAFVRRQSLLVEGERVELTDLTFDGHRRYLRFFYYRGDSEDETVFSFGNADHAYTLHVTRGRAFVRTAGGDLEPIEVHTDQWNVIEFAVYFQNERHLGTIRINALPALRSGIVTGGADRVVVEPTGRVALAGFQMMTQE